MFIALYWTFLAAWFISIISVIVGITTEYPISAGWFIAIWISWISFAVLGIFT